MNKLIFLILTLSLSVSLFGQRPTPSPKITNILDSYPNELYASLQGEHELLENVGRQENAGWITFENFNFKLTATWSKKDKMLGMGTGNPGQAYYKTSAIIKGQYSIEEIKIDNKQNYTETDKYGDPVKVIKRGFIYGYKIYFSGTDANGKYYNFCSDVAQEYKNGYMYNWVVGNYTCEKGTNEIDLSFNITKYFKGDPAAYKKAEALRLELKRNEEIALRNEEERKRNREERKKKEAEELKLKIKLDNDNAFYSKFNCIIKSDRFKNLKYGSNKEVIGLPKYIRYLKNDTLFWFHDNDSVSYEFKDTKFILGKSEFWVNQENINVKIKGNWKCGNNDSLIVTDDYGNYLLEKERNIKEAARIKNKTRQEMAQTLLNNRNTENAELLQLIDKDKYSYKEYVIILTVPPDGPKNYKLLSIFKDGMCLYEFKYHYEIYKMFMTELEYLDVFRTRIQFYINLLNSGKDIIRYF